MSLRLACEDVSSELLATPQEGNPPENKAMREGSRTDRRMGREGGRVAGPLDQAAPDLFRNISQ